MRIQRDPLGIPPGEVLYSEFMAPNRIKSKTLTQEMDVSARQLSRLIHHRCGMSFKMAKKLGKYFGTSRLFWHRLEVLYQEQKALNC